MRKDFAWDPAWVARVDRADPAAVDRARPDRRARRGRDAPGVAARRPAARDRGRRPLAAVGEGRRVPARPTATSSSSARTRHELRSSASSGCHTRRSPPCSRRQKPAEPGGRFLADAARVAEAVARLAPDAVVVIGPDHFHANFYDVMPPFVLGVESAIGFGDFDSRSGPLPVATQLAWSIRDGLAEAGFDVSLSYSLTVDHGVVQSYDMVSGGTDIPLVPLVVNTAAPPLPSMERCVLLGTALGSAIRAVRVRRPGAHRRQRWAVALAAVQRPARPVSGRGASRGGDPRPEGRPRLRRGARASGPCHGWRPQCPRQRRVGRLVPQAAHGRRSGADRSAGRRGLGGERRTWRPRDTDLADRARRGRTSRSCGPVTSRFPSGSREWASGLPSRSADMRPYTRTLDAGVAEAFGRLAAARANGRPCARCVTCCLRATSMRRTPSSPRGSRTGSRRGPGSSAARSGSPTRPCRRSSASTGLTSGSCSTTWPARLVCLSTSPHAAAEDRGRDRFRAGARPRRHPDRPDRGRAATAAVVAALEIVDSRIAGWDIGIVDTVADNASSGLFTLGGRRRELGDLDLPAAR